MYRCETTSVHGFIQQLAVCYVGRGYLFYVTGRVPEKKDPRQVDAKLIGRYGIAVSPAERSRRKQAGWGNAQYLRHGRFFVLLCTHGHHPLREGERGLRDVRRVSLKYGGYEVTYRGGHPRVSIERGEYKRRKAQLVELATCRTSAEMAAELGRLPFEPYAPVRRQLLTILRAVNARRQSQGLRRVEKSCLRLKRRIYRPFREDEAGQSRPAGLARQSAA
jgi:hypothetical protein